MRKLSLLFIAILLIGIASAVSIDYQIIGDKVFVNAGLGEVNDFEFRIPYDIDTFESDSAFEVLDFGTYKILKVNSSENLSFSYITQVFIEEGETKNFFVMKNYLDKPFNATLSLPEAGVLMEDFSLIFPENAKIYTDGRKVFLQWKNFQDDEIVVGYEIIKDENYFWIVLLIMLLIGFGVVYVFQSRKLRKQIESWKSRKTNKKKSHEKRKEDVSRNLFREEKQIIDYLMDKKGHECWTKEIAKDLNISKVRLSRKLRNLEQKGLISKEPYGNENRIKLLKTS